MQDKKQHFPSILALAVLAFTFSLAVCAQAQTVTNLANFDGSNGHDPQGGVIQATDGNFYGVTFTGGTKDSGSMFQLSPGGQLRSIYSFCSQPKCADGLYSTATPVLGSDGSLYGVVGEGGSNAGYEQGSGIFYKMTLRGQITILYTFCTIAPCTDGQFPVGITQGYDGNFYGTTYGGGAFNSGTIFQITPTGKLKVLYSFCSLMNCADGWQPEFPPIQGIDGNYYGVTLGGGALGAGALYELTPSGTYSVLHSFCYGDGCNGTQPNQIVQDAHGNLFGTTVWGGSSATGGKVGFGTVYEFTSTHQYIVLDNFDYVRGTPGSGIALANDGNLYTTSAGSYDTGDSGGTIFKVTPTGNYTELYTFGVCSTLGYLPATALIQATDGLIYGSTIYGGKGEGTSCADNGTIYTLSTGLSPMVQVVPPGGKIGKHVIILGNGLTGATSVTFNGVPAVFTVEKDTAISVTVPTGATTGTVSVVTPSGTLNSNPQFVVTK
jgi:uncharacterized repeat protein (TIGR03803 family)